MRPYLSALLLAALLLLPPAATALGASQVMQDGAGGKLDIHIDPDFTPRARVQLETWITFIARSLQQVYGHWPNRHWRITVTPASGAGEDPIPWAQVNRGPVSSVEFYTLGNASADELIDAWTGYHELAHLLIPYRGWGDAWFSEGLASYYQNLMQGRAARLDESEVWQKLYEGFMRGRSDTRFDGQALAAVSDGMRENGGYMRVYWSGAWYFLAADARLRQQSGGTLTLDRALEQLNRCCAEQALSVPQMVAKLDELNRVILFRPLYQQAIQSTAVPAFEPIFASLGITVEDGVVHLQQAGPGAELRRRILTPSPL